MDLDKLIELLRSITDATTRRGAVRTLVLNEAFYNKAIIDLLETKAISGCTADRNKLILELRTDSRKVKDVLDIDRTAFDKVKGAIWRLVAMDPPAPEQEAITDERFAALAETDLYHYTMNRIEVLQTVVRLQLQHEADIRFTIRIANLRRATRALIERMRG
jgi:hypothetical protein